MGSDRWLKPAIRCGKFEVGSLKCSPPPTSHFLTIQRSAIHDSRWSKKSAQGTSRNESRTSPNELSIRSAPWALCHSKVRIPRGPVNRGLVDWFSRPTDATTTRWHQIDDRSTLSDLKSKGYPRFPQVCTGFCAQGHVGNFLRSVFAFTANAQHRSERQLNGLGHCSQRGFHKPFPRTTRPQVLDRRPTR